ncbi:MAG: twin-arginine translocation signal domain-containing protein, partial [Deltaproteobacteria bacterium]
MPRSPSLTRRSFLGTATAGATAALLAPAVHASSKSGSQVTVGSGDYKYKVIHDWAQLPDTFTWQTTHNVAVDRDNFLYVIHEGRKDQQDHPAIFVFDPKGKYVRSFGKQFQGGGHGLEVREEDSQQFLYVTGFQHLKNFAKLDLKGEQVWEKRAPMESGVYAVKEDTQPEAVWGHNRFMPTNFAFHPDGGFYLADGYGSFKIHRYDKDGKWLSAFGTRGKGEGQFHLPHGLWIDDRQAEPSVVIADRVNARLQWFSMDGKYQKTLDGFILPANVDILGDVMLVPDLSARIT